LAFDRINGVSRRMSRRSDRRDARNKQGISVEG
jgi:hypothetical protein